jgi:hypothetical protein
LSTAGPPSTWLSRYLYYIPSLSFPSLPSSSFPAVVISAFSFSFSFANGFSLPCSFFTTLIQQRHGRTFDVSDYVLPPEIKVPYLKLLMLQAVSPVLTLSYRTLLCPRTACPVIRCSTTSCILYAITLYLLFFAARCCTIICCV